MKMKKSSKDCLEGFCQLTKVHGQFVKSHIIPASLTRLNSDGQKIVEVGIGLGVKKKPATWYDNQLVIRSGEDILEAIDTPAIEILRKHKFIWSGWGNEEKLISDDFIAESDEISFRSVTIEGAKTLQLFFLSLLWRAAASQRPEFREIKIEQDTLEDLRLRVSNKNPGPHRDYPIQLFQIISKGINHNRAPTQEIKSIEIESGIQAQIEYVRFYLEGLVAHVHLPAKNAFADQYISTCLRSDTSTLIFAHTFDHSRTFANIKEMAAKVSAEEHMPPSNLNTIQSAIANEYLPRAYHQSRNIFTDPTSRDGLSY